VTENRTSRQNARGPLRLCSIPTVASGFSHAPESRIPTIIERVLALKRSLLAHMSYRSSGRTSRPLAGSIVEFRSPRGSLGLYPAIG
jgi:hypothetical protein